MKNRGNYPENWFDVIRPDILKKDNFKCKDCGLKHKSVGYYDRKGNFVECDNFIKDWAVKNGFKVQKISLQIAHLDQNPSNNNYSNLECKCPKCHLKFDEPFNKMKRLTRRGKTSLQIKTSGT